MFCTEDMAQSSIDQNCSYVSGAVFAQSFFSDSAVQMTYYQRTGLDLNTVDRKARKSSGKS